MKKAAPQYQQSSPSQGQFTTPSNGLLRPSVQTGVQQGLVLEHGWKARNKSIKNTRALRRTMKAQGMTPEQIEEMLVDMGMGAKQ